jgi:CubicO group peptidase (beta-lactamase class C family)
LTIQETAKMNRRTFNAISVASLLAPLPNVTFAQQATPNLAGYQVAEINDGRLSRRNGNMATPQSAVDDDTLFQVASCSKTVTALAILTLVRDGRLELDQPANRYLRRWKIPGPRGAVATVQELMSHTAGTTVHGFDGYGTDENIPSMLEILAGNRPANSGAVRARRRLLGRFKYSGGGTMVLQALIEDVTGKNFATYTEAEVLTRVGAPRATFAMKPTAAFAYGSYQDGRALDGGFRRHPESAAAGLWATASDLARIMEAIVNSLRGVHGAIMPVALAQRMVTPLGWRSGLGVFVNPGATISHEGRNHGFDSIMVAELETGRIRAAVTNQNGAIESYARDLLPN